MNKRRFVVTMSGAVLVSAAIVYGCSDDKTSTTPPPITTDSGGNTKDSPTADQNSPQDTGTDAPAKAVATAEIKATTDGGTVSGTATFTEENGEVTVVVNMTKGFPPGAEGMHGMHIHVNPSCDPTDAGGGTVTAAGAAGGHWNPADASHGYPTAAMHHLGDMGNISIGADGKGTLTLVSKEWTVKPGPNSVVGHALVFHIQQDDGTSQPVGDAGSRPGCGLILAK